MITCLMNKETCCTLKQFSLFQQQREFKWVLLSCFNPHPACSCRQPCFLMVGSPLRLSCFWATVWLSTRLYHMEATLCPGVSSTPSVPSVPESLMTLPLIVALQPARVQDLWGKTQKIGDPFIPNEIQKRKKCLVLWDSDKDRKTELH